LLKEFHQYLVLLTGVEDLTVCIKEVDYLDKNKEAYRLDKIPENLSDATILISDVGLRQGRPRASRKIIDELSIPAGPSGDTLRETLFYQAIKTNDIAWVSEFSDKQSEITDCHKSGYVAPVVILDRAFWLVCVGSPSLVAWDSLDLRDVAASIADALAEYLGFLWIFTNIAERPLILLESSKTFEEFIDGDDEGPDSGLPENNPEN